MTEDCGDISQASFSNMNSYITGRKYIGQLNLISDVMEIITFHVDMD